MTEAKLKEITSLSDLRPGVEVVVMSLGSTTHGKVITSTEKNGLWVGDGLTLPMIFNPGKGGLVDYLREDRHFGLEPPFVYNRKSGPSFHWEGTFPNPYTNMYGVEER